MLCGKLWHTACRAAARDDSPSDLPVSFRSAAHYISAYEPLIFEEARESVLHAKSDQTSVQTQAVVSRCDVGPQLPSVSAPHRGLKFWAKTLPCCLSCTAKANH